VLTITHRLISTGGPQLLGAARRGVDLDDLDDLDDDAAPAPPAGGDREIA